MKLAYPENWFAALVVLAFNAISWVFVKTTVVFGVVIAGAISGVFSLLLRGKREPKPTVKARSKAAQATQDAGAEFQNTVFVDKPTLQAGGFKVADRLVSLALDPDVAVVHLRVYYAEKVVRRWMVVKEPLLRALMKGREHALPDAAFDPMIGLNGIKKESVALAEKLINSFGEQMSQSAAQERREKVEVTPKSILRVERQIGGEKRSDKRAGADKKATAAVRPATVPPPAPGQRYVPTATIGQTFEGVLIEAAPTTIRPAGRTPYEVFQARLRLANGAEIPFRGAELERELGSVGIGIGDHVSITPQGKVPVDLANGSTGSKNVYRVERI